MGTLHGARRAQRHDLVRAEAAPDFFEGALLGNGGMGVVVCTREDALVLHFGHNEVWDIRLAEANGDKLLTFAQLRARMDETWAKGGSIQGDSWLKEYCRLARENFAKPYPRPFPCGTVVLGFDPRRTHLRGHRLALAEGRCTVDFAEGQLDIFVEQEQDRLWLAMRDGAAAPFTRVRVIPDDGGKVSDGWMSEGGKEKAAGMPAPVLGEDGRSFRQRLPAREDGAEDVRDRAMELRAVLDAGWTGHIDLWSGSAQERAQVTMAPGDLARARRGAKKYWAEYWRCSAVALDDELLEAVWYRNQYFHACVARPGVTCPGLFGNWSKGAIGTAWHGDYHLDYNTQQAFWGCLSSNHARQHEPYVAMVHHVLDVARHWARTHYEMRGACFPTSVYPIKMNQSPYPLPTWGWIMCVTPWTVQSLWWHYLYTMDETFLRERAWEPLREAVMFLVDFLSRPEAHGSAWGDDRYHVIPTVAPELHSLTDRFERNRDCLVDVTLMRFVLRAFLEACRVLGREDELRAQVRDIVEHLPDYATAQTPEGPVYVSVPGESPETVYNVPNPGMTVFPGEHHGLHSPPEILELARRSWRHTCTEGNTDLVFYALQGARLGILDLARFKQYIRYCLRANGTCTDRATQAGGRYSDTVDVDFMCRMGVWIENFALPAVVNECLMQSYTGEIRLFPNWPAGGWARFQTLRAVGAFLVSAETGPEGVRWVEVHSEAGATLRLHNPWAAARCDGGERVTERLIVQGTRRGQTLRFEPG